MLTLGPADDALCGVVALGVCGADPDAGDCAAEDEAMELWLVDAWLPLPLPEAELLAEEETVAEAAPYLSDMAPAVVLLNLTSMELATDEPEGDLAGSGAAGSSIGYLGF